MTDFTQVYVLKITGKHGLVFKCKDTDKDYLKKIAENQLKEEGTDFTDYEIHPSDHSNSELTEAEQLLHFTPKCRG
ncbi:hypothetical protein [Thiomicrorhabdus sp. Milos-T2]|uniref:hypothetical protein n=1 Tax=Thiomicrorhabdus sp. Milos-T2 TaxID=90814 RepID=UPI00049477BD|nr:hypothetical protein [Thiomicrorhabdus sp. Milos-T2]